MRFRKIFVLVMLGLSFSIAAEFRTITEAYELTLGDLRLPGSEYGTLAIKRCSECDPEMLRVTGMTRYFINNRAYPFVEFIAQLKDVRNPKDQSALIFHHLESNTVEEIKVWVR